MVFAKPLGSRSIKLEAVCALSARVRRRFGDKYARIARAYLNGKTLERKGIPRRTFLYAVKKKSNFSGTPINSG